MGKIKEVIWRLCAEEELRMVITQVITYYAVGKVGITGQVPEERFKQHLSKKNNEYDWDKMMVLYKTNSEERANEIEKMLAKEYEDYFVNKKAGGGSDLSEEGQSYYVYLLLLDY